MNLKFMNMLLAVSVGFIVLSGSVRFSAQEGSSTGILPAPTTSSTGGSTATTGGSSGSTSGYVVWPDVDLTGVEEASGTTSYENEKFHCFRQHFSIQNIPANVSGQPIANTNPQQYLDSTYSVALCSSCVGSDPTSGELYFTLDNRSATGGDETISNPNTGKQYNVFGYSVQNGDTLTNRTGGGASQTYNLILSVNDSGDTYTLNPDGSKHELTNFNTTTYSEADLSCNRFSLDSASVDTRKTYGQPDLAGELPGDANAPASNINFHNWIFRGGSFVGNAPFLQTNDQSGTSRLQLYGTGISYVDPIWADLSLTRLPPPSSSYDNPMEIAGYLIDPSDPNYSVSPSSATWATAWNPFASTAKEGTPETVSGNTPAPPLEYLNLTMPKPGAGTVNIAVAMVNESSEVASNFVGWQYFEDASYQSQYLTSPLPINDGTPRLWLVDETATNGWVVQNP